MTSGETKWETMVPGRVWHHYPSGEPFRFLVAQQEGEAFGWSVRGGEADSDGFYPVLASGTAPSRASHASRAVR